MHFKGIRLSKHIIRAHKECLSLDQLKDKEYRLNAFEIYFVCMCVGISIQIISDMLMGALAEGNVKTDTY